jgi:hypothetical protein
MALPADIARYVERTFGTSDQATVLELLSHAVIHDGQPAGARLMRCALIASGGTLLGLVSQLDQLKVDYRDVIVAGEYLPKAGNLIQYSQLE